MQTLAKRIWLPLVLQRSLCSCALGLRFDRTLSLPPQLLVILLYTLCASSLLSCYTLDSLASTLPRRHGSYKALRRQSVTVVHVPSRAISQPTAGVGPRVSARKLIRAYLRLLARFA